MQHRPSQAADGLAPAEGLLNPFALLLADLVPGMAGRAAIDGREPIGRVLSHVRCNAQVDHEVGRVEALVGTSNTREPLEQLTDLRGSRTKKNRGGLNCRVTETNDTPWPSNDSTSLS